MHPRNPYFTTVISLVLAFCLASTANVGGQSCSEGFYQEAAKRHRKITFCQKKVLGLEFGWTYYNESRRLDILLGAKLDGDRHHHVAEMGWVAWGLNPTKHAQMVGTRALIGIKLKNGSLACNTYNITRGTKLGCGLLPSAIDLGVHNFSFTYVEHLEYNYVMQATVVLPHAYNYSSINHVWQVGGKVAAAALQPLMHHKHLENFDSTETLDLLSGAVYSIQPEKLRSLAGWGAFLPIGVIIARHCKEHPFETRNWFLFHVCCQILGYILGTIGWILGLWLGRNSRYYYFSTHRILGILIFTLATVQMSAFRFKPGTEDPHRVYWNMFHHGLGYTLLALISANIFKGICILKPNHMNWMWAYIGLLGFLAWVALALDIFSWVMFWQQKNEKKASEKLDKQAQAPPPPPAAAAGRPGSVSGSEESISVGHGHTSSKS